jgi:hypothetical protein
MPQAHGEWPPQITLTRDRRAVGDTLFKTDNPRAIDCWINYFGELPSSPLTQLVSEARRASGFSWSSGGTATHLARKALAQIHEVVEDLVRVRVTPETSKERIAH